ncbi:MAG: gamma-glutamyltransferase, partial [Trebonia sp.]
ALLDGALAGLEWLSAEAVDLMARAAARAFRDRWERCGSDGDAWRSLLAPDAVSAARHALRSWSAGLPVRGLRPDGDTTSMVAVDRDGRAVSFIHSLAFTFGARLTIPGTGIVLNNRLGRGAYLVEGHPNAVRPRRRPLHTLNAWLATDEAGRLLHVGNTPGGDGQVQWNMQILSHLADHGLDPQRAVSAPRFTISPGSDANMIGAPAELACESRLGAATIASLRTLGHTVRETGPWAAGGSALVISADEARGVLAGGADPRQDGVVLGDWRQPARVASSAGPLLDTCLKLTVYIACTPGLPGTPWSPTGRPRRFSGCPARASPRAPRSASPASRRVPRSRSS